MAFSFRPTNANTLSVQLGVVHTLSNCIINNETISETAQTLEVHDQAYRIAQVIAYERQYDIRLEVTCPAGSPPCNTGDTISWYDTKGDQLSAICNTCEFVATWNDVAKYNIQCTAGSHATYHNKIDDEL